MNPSRAWQSALGQLQAEMPKATFDTWLRQAELVSYEDGAFYIGVANTYARDWLENRVSSTITRLLTGIVNHPVGVHFIVWPEENERDVADTGTGVDPAEQQLKIQITHQSLRDALVEPHKVVVIPGYFRRWVPILGPTLAWIVVGFRQMMYLQTRKKARADVTFSVSPQQLARWAGVARNTLWRNLKDHRLRWFLKQENPEQHDYEFIATTPLTPADAERLLEFLVNAGARSDPQAAIQAALDTPVSQILPNPPPPPREGHLDMEPRPRSVPEVVFEACGNVRASVFQQVSELADQLAAHLMPPQDVIIVSHYFLRRWIKQLGPAPSWFITLLRDQCYVSKDEVRNTVWITDGDPEIARMLGLSRPKTISEWLTPLEDSRFERPPRPAPTSRQQKKRAERVNRREAKRGLVAQFIERDDYSDVGNVTSWRFKVNPIEPLVPEDQAKYTTAMALIAAFLESRSLSHLREALLDGGGALGTAEGANGTHLRELEARMEHVEARMEQTPGALGTDGGADGTKRRRVWSALSSIKSLKAPMLSLVKHLEELSTATTRETDAAENQDSELTLVVGELPEEWDLVKLLSASGLHPGTRQKLRAGDLEPWVLVSHLLYAHSSQASRVENPIALVGSAILEDPQHGQGGHFDVLAKLPPCELADLIGQAHDYASQYPESYSTWRAGHQAWERAMANTKAAQLQELAARLGLTRGP